MKVDNTTNLVFGQKRNTVRITTKDQFAVGSVWIADMLHVPFGVSLPFHLRLWWLCQCAVSCPYGSPPYHKRDIEEEPSSCPSWPFFTTSGRIYILHHAYSDATSHVAPPPLPLYL
jgi:hypothetical protein